MVFRDHRYDPFTGYVEKDFASPLVNAGLNINVEEIKKEIIKMFPFGTGVHVIEYESLTSFYFREIDTNVCICCA